ncbi:DedA family protein [Candidatus Nomurabacteria bacterium]|nr:DedA family protein [Candidatus Nomurabacteria bacterium]
MDAPVLDDITTKGRLWQWFLEHAKSRFALVWLALIAFTDTLFSPITAEPFLAALVLAHRDRWKRYLAVALTFSTLGTIAGYWILFWLYRAYGEALLASWGYTDAYATAQAVLAGSIFWAMLLASVTPIPDKALIYAAGILGSPFAPFVAGFVLGRGIRMSIVTYIVWAFGEQVLEAVDKYAVWASVLILTVFAGYAIVRFDLWPW